MSEKPSVLARTASVLDGMPPALRQSLVVLLIVLGGGIVGWIGRGVLMGPPSDTTTVTVYQGWQVVCPSSKDKDATCKIFREITDDKTGQRLVGVTIGADKDKKDPIATISVPLGVALGKGLNLRLGGEDAKVYPYKVCGAAGCAVIMPFDDKTEKSFKNAQDATVTVTRPQDGQDINWTFTMNGFNDARHAYLNGEAKRKNWFWRLWL
jgi:invasion protein IalB